ncbi:MAG TPA: HEAT repeat domain-containing protein [Chloroflexia bacterium]|nr:HEAT repeat domain-containing protein [Chloroflexia bacterium]
MGTSVEDEINSIVRTLQGKRLKLRLEAVADLGKFNNKQANDILLRLFNTQEEASIIRAQAVFSLSQLSDNEIAFQLLKQAMEDNDPRVRTYAASALKKVRHQEAINLLIKHLRSDVWQVRFIAAFSLGEIGDKQAVEPLMQALKDRSRAVRLHVALALGKIGDKRAIQPLLIALQDKDPIVRYRVAQALGRLGDKQALEKLKSLTLNDITPVLQGYRVRDAAIDAIKRIEEQEMKVFPRTFTRSSEEI